MAFMPLSSVLINIFLTRFLNGLNTDANPMAGCHSQPDERL